MLDRRLGWFFRGSARSRFMAYGLVLFALVIIVGVIVVLGHSGRVDEPTDFDVAIHYWVVGLRDGWPRLTRWMLWVTRLGDPPVATVATVVVMLWLGALHRRSIAGIRRREAFIWLGVILGAQYLSRALKLFYERQRPPRINQLVVETAYSFPSGHSVFAGAFYTMLAILLTGIIPSSRVWLRRGVVALCLFAAIAIGLSRVWLGVHYPTDVLAGLLIGSSTAAGVWLIRLGWRHANRTGQGDRSGEMSEPGSENRPAGVD